VAAGTAALGGRPAVSTPTQTGPSEDHIQRAARLLFDKANPDVPGGIGRDRDQWFAETRDYWERAARELADVLGTPMTVTCACGWTAAGPAKETQFIAIDHKCELTSPWFGRHRAQAARQDHAHG
jgi:hypothetical protein